MVLRIKTQLMLCILKIAYTYDCNANKGKALNFPQKSVT